MYVISPKLQPKLIQICASYPVLLFVLSELMSAVGGAACRSCRTSLTKRHAKSSSHRFSGCRSDSLSAACITADNVMAVQDHPGGVNSLVSSSQIISPKGTTGPVEQQHHISHCQQLQPHLLPYFHQQSGGAHHALPLAVVAPAKHDNCYGKITATETAAAAPAGNLDAQVALSCQVMIAEGAAPVIALQAAPRTENTPENCSWEALADRLVEQILADLENKSSTAVAAAKMHSANQESTSAAALVVPSNQGALFGPAAPAAARAAGRAGNHPNKHRRLTQQVQSMGEASSPVGHALKPIFFQTSLLQPGGHSGTVVQQQPSGSIRGPAGHPPLAAAAAANMPTRTTHTAAAAALATAVPAQRLCGAKTGMDFTEVQCLHQQSLAVADLLEDVRKQLEAIDMLTAAYHCDFGLRRCLSG
jgi:hypothetical protein